MNSSYVFFKHSCVSRGKFMSFLSLRDEKNFVAVPLPRRKLKKEVFKRVCGNRSVFALFAVVPLSSRNPLDSYGGYSDMT
jgi:hypothetical protein